MWQINKSKIVIFNKHGNVKKCTPFYYGKHVIEHVKCYTYLGIIFTSNGTFTNAVECLKDKALKAMHNVMAYTGEMQPMLALRIFDKMIKPIINYGSEIWICNFTEGIKMHSKIETFDKPSTERVPLKFAKYTLGVHSKSSNAAVRGELGLFPSMIAQCKLAVRYWQHLLKLTENCIAYKSLMECIEIN